jgi:hypothetical protein
MADQGQDIDPRLLAILSGVIDSNDELTPEAMARLPKTTPGTPQYPWSDPLKNIMAGVEGMPIGRGMMAAPGAAKMALTEILARTPKSAAAGVPALAATLAGTNEAGSQDQAPLQRLYEQQAAIQRQAEDARTRREAMRPKGRAPNAQQDPQFTAADQEYSRLSGQLEGVGRAIEAENQRSSPEWRRRQEEADQLAKQTREQQAAKRPWRERNPELAADWSKYTILASIMAGLGFKGAEKAAKYVGNMPWHKTVGEAKDMVAKGDAGVTPLLRELAERNKGYVAQPPSGSGAAMMGGAAAGAEMGMYPLQSDIANLGFAEAVKDPWELGKVGINMGLGALTGGTAAKFGQVAIPDSKPPIESSRALASILSATSAQDAGKVATNLERMGLRSPGGGFGSDFATAQGRTQLPTSPATQGQQFSQPQQSLSGALANTGGPSQGPEDLAKVLSSSRASPSATPKTPTADPKRQAETEWRKATGTHHINDQNRGPDGKLLPGKRKINGSLSSILAGTAGYESLSDGPSSDYGDF